jgi:gas vesicle protein
MTQDSTTAPSDGEQSNVEQAKERVQEVTGQAQEKASEVAGQARSKVREQIDTRSGDAAQQIGETTQALRSTGDQLRQQGKETPARLAQQAADAGDRIAGYLRDADADRMLRDIEAFGRRRPAAMALGGLLLGFAASRFLKASSEQRFSTQTSRPPQPAALPPSRPIGNGGGAHAPEPVGHVA